MRRRPPLNSDRRVGKTTSNTTGEPMRLNSTLKAAERQLRSSLVNEVRSLTSDSNLTLGRMAAWKVRSMEVLSTLTEAEFSVSSQWGQDGILDWLIERADLPPALHSFIEFG